MLPTVAEGLVEEAEALASPTTPAAEGERGTNTRVTFCALCEWESREEIVLVGDGAGGSDADTRVEDAVSDTAAATTLEEVTLPFAKVDVGIEEEASTSAALTVEVAEGEDEDDVDDPASESSAL